MKTSPQVKAACDGQVWLMGKETSPGLMALASHFWWSCR